jgi:hypothetical protein
VCRGGFETRPYGEPCFENPEKVNGDDDETVGGEKFFAPLQQTGSAVATLPEKNLSTIIPTLFDITYSILKVTFFLPA